MKKLIIDANNLGYIAHFSTGSLSISTQKTGVIFGFLKKVLDLAIRFETNQFIFCWDSKENHRKKIYPKYKIKRWESLTEEQRRERVIIKDQFKQLRREVLPSLGFKNNYVQRGFESDDLMASIVITNSFLKDNDFVMVTSDNDMYQCLNFCSIYSLQQDKIFTKEDFIKKYKINPEQWARAKAIGGCSTDNVEGIKGASDPKNEKSKALAYIRGELKNGIVYDRIEKSRVLIERNLKLVKLPYNILGKVYPKNRSIRYDKFEKKNFIKVFDQFKFLSFIKNINKWKEAFVK